MAKRDLRAELLKIASGGDAGANELSPAVMAPHGRAYDALHKLSRTGRHRDEDCEEECVDAPGDLLVPLP